MNKAQKAARRAAVAVLRWFRGESRARQSAKCAELRRSIRQQIENDGRGFARTQWVLEGRRRG